MCGSALYLQESLAFQSRILVGCFPVPMLDRTMLAATIGHVWDAAALRNGRGETDRHPRT